MIAIDPRSGESLDAYLARCLQTARRTKTTIATLYDGVSMTVTRSMSSEQVAREWQRYGGRAKASKRKKKGGE